MMLKKIIGMTIFLVGLCILLYPQWIIFYNDFKRDRAIASYYEQAAVSKFAVEKESASILNAEMENWGDGQIDPFGEDKADQQGEAGDEIIGYLELPKIGENLPIYMGATDDHLSKGIGIIQGTSLPYGGVNTHSVLAGHRGYKYSRFLRNIDDMVTGDIFFVHIYGEKHAYKVYEKETILPTQTDKLDLIPDKDIITLLTCHPYGSSTYRLLVKGERTTVEKEKIKKENQYFDKAAFFQYRLMNRAIVVIGTIMIAAIFIAFFRLIFTSIKEKKNPPLS